MKKIYFIGIGGIGVSALARYFLACPVRGDASNGARGFWVSGSDAAESEIVEELRKQGAKIPHPSPLLIKERGKKGNIDLVIYSAAVPEDNPELVEARKRGIKCQTYAQALGELTKKYFTIAVSGTHGKSTTTAMIGLILEAAGLDPTVIVGTKVKWNIPHPDPLLIKEREREMSNFRMGRGKYLVIEADEYAASFLNYWPKIIVLTNIEEDHLDYYRDLNHIIKTFDEYISHLEKDGVLVANEEDKNINKIFNFQFSIFNKFSKPKFQIQKYKSIDLPKGLKLQIPGRHNLSNAAAAMAAARLLNISDEISTKTLNNFSGTWRRMEYKGEINGAKIYDDYGHHPTEIKATLAGARDLLEMRAAGSSFSTAHANPIRSLRSGCRSSLGARRAFKNIGRLWCVFQPHQYQRTYHLFDQFVSAFENADKVILLPIYSVAGREKEKIKKKVNSKMLAEAIRIENFTPSGIEGQEVVYSDSFDGAQKYLKKNLKKGDICIIMGAGDIYLLTQKLKLKFFDNS